MEILVAVVEAAYLSNSSQPVSMVCHSMGGIWGTYAATDTRLTGKVKRIVFAGAADTPMWLRVRGTTPALVPQLFSKRFRSSKQNTMAWKFS